MIRPWQLLLLAATLLAPTGAWADWKDSNRESYNDSATYRTIDDYGYRYGRGRYSYDRDYYGNSDSWRRQEWQRRQALRAWERDRRRAQREWQRDRREYWRDYRYRPYRY